RDAEAAKLAKTSDVSVWLLPDYEDGNRNKYDYVVRHVALTDYPVISSMDRFKQIAASEGADVLASWTTNDDRRQQMLTKLIQTLGLQLSEDQNKDEAKQTELVLAEITRLVDEQKKTGEATKKLEAELT